MGSPIKAPRRGLRLAVPKRGALSAGIALALSAIIAGLTFSISSTLPQQVNELTYCSVSGDGEFRRMASGEEPLAVMFSSPSCPICHVMEPYWVELCRSQNGSARLILVRLDTDTLELFREYNVTETPTFLVITEGRVIARHVGSFGSGPEALENMKAWVESVIASAAGRPQRPAIASKATAGVGVPTALATAFTAGLAATLSPCVLPVLALYALIPGQAVPAKRSGARRLYYMIVGAVGGALVAGLLFLAIGSTVGGSTGLTTAAALGLVSVGLSMCVGVPVYTGVPRAASRRFLGFSFFYGALAVQCSLPVLAGALVLAASAGLGGITILGGFLAGLALPMIALAAATSRPRIAYLLVKISRGSARVMGAALAVGGLLVVADSLGLI